MRAAVRRALLFVPGSSARMLQKAAATTADVLVLDLEDAVSPTEKESARQIVRDALPTLRQTGKELWVRVNAMDSMWGITDVLTLTAAGPDVFLIPKADERAMILADGLLHAAEAEAGRAEGGIALVALIETAKGLAGISEVLRASPRLNGVLLGGEDLTRDLGVQRTRAGTELSHARHTMVLAARAAGLDSFDTPFPAPRDGEGLLLDAQTAKAMGFTGKACIHPDHIAGIHAAFSPPAEALNRARRLLRAFSEAEAQGKGACLFEGEMVDRPIALRAERLLAEAGEA